MFKWLKEKLQTEIGVMCLVVLLYLVKVPVKLSLGLYIHSPVIYGDAWHNLADMMQSVLVIGAIFFKRIPSLLVSFMLALGLIYTACDIGISSWGGVLYNFPSLNEYTPLICRASAPEALVFGKEYLRFIAPVLLLGILFSFAVGKWQVMVGTSRGNKSVVLDGKETMGDGAIELAVLLGVLGEYLFDIPWLEYPLGLIISTLLFYVGFEALYDNWKIKQK